MSLREDLDRAWQWRLQSGVLQRLPAVRVFHGPGEASSPVGAGLLIEKFGSGFWIFEREGEGKPAPEDTVLEFLQELGARRAVWLRRPKKGVPEEAVLVLGNDTEPVELEEGGLRMQIRFRDTRHPGLFLDHEPLRAWLQQNRVGGRVLNLFAYTGSLSIAAARGGAQHVTTLDLSKPTLEWARLNWELNSLGHVDARFMAEDSFKGLQRLAKAGETFDTVILDPPSFSRDKNGKTFSTAKDLEALHDAVFKVMNPAGGWVITSINSANCSREQYARDVLNAAKRNRFQVQVQRQIDAPETFPTRLDQPESRYLKGWILRVRRA
jgi:23S rRNA (cytosine1962-C5)-methyltransferase